MAATTSNSANPRSHSKKRVSTLNFDQYASEGNRFINEVCEQLGTENRNKAARITKAVLHTIRDRIPTDEAVHLAQQLPMALKGVFFDQYDPTKAPLRLRTKVEFIEYLASKDMMAAKNDFKSEEDAKAALHAVFKVLERHISEGQLNQVKALIPSDIMKLIDPEFIYPSNIKTQQNMNRNTRTRGSFGYSDRQNDYGYDDRMYGQGYGRGTSSGYNTGYYGRGSDMRDDDMRFSSYRDRDRDEPNWFERAGDRVREGWNDLRNRFTDDDRDYHTRGHYGRGGDDRNWFERAGDKISETWNDLRGRDDDRDYDDYRTRGGYGSRMSDQYYGRGTSGYPSQGRGYDDTDMNYRSSRYGRNYPSQGRW